MVELDEDDEEEKRRETAAMDEEAFFQGMNGAAALDSYDTQENHDPGDEDNYEDDFEVKITSEYTTF